PSHKGLNECPAAGASFSVVTYKSHGVEQSCDTAKEPKKRWCDPSQSSGFALRTCFEIQVTHTFLGWLSILTVQGVRNLFSWKRLKFFPANTLDGPPVDNNPFPDKPCHFLIVGLKPVTDHCASAAIDRIMRHARSYNTRIMVCTMVKSNFTRSTAS